MVGGMGVLSVGDGEHAAVGREWVAGGWRCGVEGARDWFEGALSCDAEQGWGCDGGVPAEAYGYAAFWEEGEWTEGGVACGGADGLTGAGVGLSAVVGEGME